MNSRYNCAVSVIIATLILLSGVTAAVEINSPNDIVTIEDQVKRPSVDAGGPYQNMTGKTIHFLGRAFPSADMYFTSYRWEFGDGNSTDVLPIRQDHDWRDTTLPDNMRDVVNDEREEPYCIELPANHTYNEDGLYLAILTVWDNTGRSLSDYALVAINRSLPSDTSLPDYPEWRAAWWWDNNVNDNIFSKKVWNGDRGGWEECTDVRIGDEIKFRISFNVDGRVDELKVIDYLPPTVRYVGASIEPDSIERVVYFDTDSFAYYPFTEITWNFGTVYSGTIEIEIWGVVEYLDKSYFDIDNDSIFPIAYLTRNVAVRTYTGHSPGCGNPYTVRQANDAVFNIVTEKPAITMIKKVKKTGDTDWYDEVNVFAGETVDFMLVSKNTGDVTIPAPILVKDHLPEGLNYNYGSASYYLCMGNTCSYPLPMEPEMQDTTLIWNFTDVSLDPNESLIIIFNATVELPGKYRNMAEVYASYDGVPLYSRDYANIKAETPPSPSIDISKTVWDGSNWVKSINAGIGENLRFKLVVTNTGGVNLTNLKVKDVLPSFLQYADASPEPSDVNGGNITWEFSRLNVSDHIEIFINATVNDIGYGNNTASVTTAEGVSDQDDASVRVDRIQISIRKLVSLDNISWQKAVYGYIENIDTVYFNLTVKNIGTADLTDIYIRDSMPRLTFLSYNNSTVPPVSTSPELVWYIDSLPAGEEFTIIYSAYAISPGCGSNTVAVNSSEGATDSDSATVIIDVTPVTDVSIEKFVSADNSSWDKVINVYEGETVYFWIRVHNTGNTCLENITVVDRLPDILSYDTGFAIPSGVVVDGNNLTWTLDGFSLAPRYTLEIYFSATAISRGAADNFAEVFAENGTTDVYANDTAKINVEHLEINLTVEKSVKKDVSYKKEVDVKIGEEVTFRIYVNNTGTVPLNVSVKDILPTGLTYDNNATPFEPDIAADGLYWNFTDVMPNESIEIVFHAIAAKPGRWTNVANVTGRYNAYPEIYAQDYAVVNISCYPDIYVDKRVWDGDEWVDSLIFDEDENLFTVRFNITVINTGTCDIDNLTIYDKLGCVLINPRNFSESCDNLTREVNYTYGYIIWHLDRTFYPGEIIYIEFDATACLLVNESTYNWVQVRGDTEEGQLIKEDTTCIYHVTELPVLAFEPEYYDAGVVTRGETISTTFDIWNAGTGVLIFNITESLDEVTVSPENGTSVGDADRVTITVDISTEDLGEGFYSFEIPIQSNGGEGVFVVNLTVVEPTEEPSLSYYPYSHDFGQVEQGNVVSTTFDIWNSGGGELSYELSWSCSWVDAYPTSGAVTDEIDTITVTVDTFSLSPGVHTCDITISSNATTATFTVSVDVIPPAQHYKKPVVEIIKPRENMLYFRNLELFKIFRTVIIGPIIIEANATDEDGSIERVEFFIDNESVGNDTEAPYTCILNDILLGQYTIRVRAYDNDGLYNESEIDAIIINFGLVELKEEYGIVMGKVTRTGGIFKRGIPNVNVTAEGTSYCNSTVTGSFLFNRGRYTLELPEGTYDIYFAADGFVTHVEYDVEVRAGETIVLNVELEPE
ncbi:MAG TPA: DUF11 domain-containing protein [Thermoplasmatales archaeon]|nr:DUF11 domain-containing protein [Thermoplasmatales archaeon]